MITLINSTTKQSVSTRFLPLTNTKGARVKATTVGGNTLTAAWDDSLTSEQNHAAAAMELIEQQGWGGEWVMGSTRGGYVFVAV